MSRMAWPGHAELKRRAETAEFELASKTAELEIADGEIERLKARVAHLETALRAAGLVEEAIKSVTADTGGSPAATYDYVMVGEYEVGPC